MNERDLLGGLIRLHILHHAAHEPIFGLGIIEELGHHGYRLSAGTVYPILHAMEKNGYLSSEAELVAGRQRRLYVTTKTGQAALALGKTKVWELFRELFEDELKFNTTRHLNPKGAAKAVRPASTRTAKAPGRASRSRPKSATD